MFALLQKRNSRERVEDFVAIPSGGPSRLCAETGERCVHLGEGTLISFSLKAKATLAGQPSSNAFSVSAASTVRYRLATHSSLLRPLQSITLSLCLGPTPLASGLTRDDLFQDGVARKRGRYALRRERRREGRERLGAAMGWLGDGVSLSWVD